MEIIVKKYNDLTLDELYGILKIRNEVFVIEQNCPYLDIDGNDRHSYHVFAQDSDGIQACLRVLYDSADLNVVMIGRVVSKHRMSGLGRQIMEEGIRIAYNILKAKTIRIEAQVQAKGFYEKNGFVQSSEEFMLDDIPHIEMIHKQ